MSVNFDPPFRDDFFPSAPEVTTLTALSKRHSSMVSVLRKKFNHDFWVVAVGLIQGDHI